MNPLTGRQLCAYCVGALNYAATLVRIRTGDMSEEFTGMAGADIITRLHTRLSTEGHDISELHINANPAGWWAVTICNGNAVCQFCIPAAMEDQRTQRRRY